MAVLLIEKLEIKNIELKIFYTYLQFMFILKAIVARYYYSMFENYSRH